jgi:hypothetical protein
MKAAVTIASDAEPTAVAWAKLAGVLVAVLVPVVFWTGAIALAGYGLGRPIATAILVGCGLVIAACSLVGASAVMAGATGRD